MIQKVLRFLIPVAILSGCAWGALWLVWNQPKPEMAEVKISLIQVRGSMLKKTDYPVTVKSQGMVQARTQSAILPEVTGKIVELSPSFNEGGYFKKDEVLVRIDPVDYETALVVAQADEARARTALAEEQAKADQAQEDFKSLTPNGISISDLALRKPQLAQAKAELSARSAEVVKAQRDVERTIVKAPYDGQVLEQNVDVGQFVNSGTTLGKIFAIDFFEVRLPLPERDLGFLKLPAHYRNTSAAEIEPVKVYLRSKLGTESVRWEAYVTRVESAIDESTRQVVAVAQIPDPCAKKADGLPPLRISQFVEAELVGEKLENVFIIPRSVVRAGNEIILITPQDTLHRVSITPLTGDDKQVIIAANASKGPREGDILCLTPIPFPAEGAKVKPVVDNGSTTASPSVATPANKATPGTLVQ